MSFESQTHTRLSSAITEPKMYSVIMYNDDYTTMDFVVEALTKIFSKSLVEATNIMMEIHEKDKGVAGKYIFDIAMTKKMQTEQMAAAKGFPLKLTVEEALQ